MSRFIDETTASALVLNGMNTAMAQASKKTKAEIKKTEEFKQARKDAKTDAMIWATQIKAIKDANQTASDEDVEAAAMAMGYAKAETEKRYKEDGEIKEWENRLKELRKLRDDIKDGK